MLAATQAQGNSNGVPPPTTTPNMSAGPVPTSVPPPNTMAHQPPSQYPLQYSQPTPVVAPPASYYRPPPPQTAPVPPVAQISTPQPIQPAPAVVPSQPQPPPPPHPQPQQPVLPPIIDPAQRVSFGEKSTRLVVHSIFTGYVITSPCSQPRTDQQFAPQ